MKSVLLTGIFLFLASAVASAKLSVDVMPESGHQDEVFTLTLKDNQPNSQGIPDLTPLHLDFVILGTQRSFNYSSINGKIKQINQWTILLKPKKSGTLTIPSISFNKQSTLPLTLQVNKQTTNSQDDNANSQQDIFLRTEVDNKKPFINQQVIYTIKLYISRRLLDRHYQPPEVENALIVSLGDAKQYQRVEQGKAYLVEEQRYAIFPQKSGEFTITPPIFTALAYDVIPHEIKTNNKPLTLNVKKAPPGNQADFLPTKDIQLSELWDSSEKNQEQGNTLVRTLYLEARGIPAQFLASLSAFRFENAKEYRVYTEKGKETNKLSNGDLVGKISIKITYLLDSPGNITLPEIRLPWFNTETGKEEVSALPPKNISVTSATTSSSAAPPSKNPEKITPFKPMVPESRIMESKPSSLPFILAAVFAFAWIITLGLWFFQKYGRNNKKKYRRALENLKKACLSNDITNTRSALLEWARLHWPDAYFLNLSDLMSKISDLKFKQQLHFLSNKLYSQTDKSIWYGEALWHAVSDFSKRKTIKKHKERVLPPMHPGQ